MTIVHEDKEFIKECGTRRMGYYLDDTLITNLEILRKSVVNGWDGIGLVTGMEGCFSIKEKVYMNGKKVMFKNIKNNSFFITKAYDFKNKKVINTMAQKVSTGNKNIFEIEFENGEKLQCTKDHRFFVKQNGKIIEKRLGDLKKNDKILWTNT